MIHDLCILIQDILAPLTPQAVKRGLEALYRVVLQVRQYRMRAIKSLCRRHRFGRAWGLLNQ